MPRLISRVRIVLALAIAGLSFCALSSPSGAAPSAVVAAPGDTMLPAGWELCLLQGIAAPATQANIDDLDEWQAAEGGSTNDSAAYDPFNTRRTTGVTNAPLPETISSNGFPAFSTWLAGCAATVATLLQPNMWSITAALRAGMSRRRACFSPTSTRASGARRRPTGHRATPTRSSGQPEISPRRYSVRPQRSACTPT